MDKIYEIKQHVVQFYAKHSRWVQMGVRFLLAVLTFAFISSHVGFMQALANPVVTIGLSVVCTFLPIVMTAVLAAGVVLVQLFTLAPGIAAVSAAMLFVMFAMYFRFTPAKSYVLLLTPIAFVAQIPVVVPVVFALLGGPIYIIPVSFGIIVYYMLAYVKAYAAVVSTVSEVGVVSQITTFTQQLLANKEMWLHIASFALCLILVYYIRRLAIDHAWEIASVAGVLVHIIVLTFAHVILNVNVSYVALVLGSVLTIVIALIVKIFFFSVDYSRAEHLQFEDEEYYYYVKAIPKVTVAVEEKTVKKINARQEVEEDKDVKVAEAPKKKDTSHEEAKLELQKKLQKEESEIQKIIEEELKN
jgi:hypothetical protein